MPSAIQQGHGKTTWCGPSAMSILTGLSSDECAELLHENNPRAYPDPSKIVGVATVDIVYTLRALGCDIGDTQHTKGKWGKLYKRWDEWGERQNYLRPTVAQWYRDVETGVYLVVVTGHFIVVEKQHGIGYATDNLKPVKQFDTWNGKRKRVRTYNRINSI